MITQQVNDMAPTTLPAMTPTFAELFLEDEGVEEDGD